jgi:hypothetical protein
VRVPVQVEEIGEQAGLDALTVASMEDPGASGGIGGKKIPSRLGKLFARGKIEVPIRTSPETETLAGQPPGMVMVPLRGK